MKHLYVLPLVLFGYCFVSTSSVFAMKRQADDTTSANTAAGVEDGNYNDLLKQLNAERRQRHAASLREQQEKEDKGKEKDQSSVNSGDTKSDKTDQKEKTKIDSSVITAQNRIQAALDEDFGPLLKNGALQKQGVKMVDKMIDDLDVILNSLETLYCDDAIIGLLEKKNPVITGLVQRLTQSVEALMHQVRMNENILDLVRHDKFRKMCNKISKLYGEKTLVEADVFLNRDAEKDIKVDQLVSFRESQKQWIAKRCVFYCAIYSAYDLVNKLVRDEILLKIDRLSDGGASTQSIYTFSTIRAKLQKIVTALEKMIDAFPKDDSLSHPKIKELIGMLYKEIIKLNNQILENYRNDILRWIAPIDNNKIRTYEELCNKIFGLCDEKIKSICDQMKVSIGSERATLVHYEFCNDTSEDEKLAAQLQEQW